MQVGYSYLRRYWSAVPKQLFVAAGLFALPLSWAADGAAKSQPAPEQVRVKQPPKAEVRKMDPRAVRLKKFLSRLHCPVGNLSEEFVQAADANHIDWRLLPSISVIESGGGKAYRNNNVFGWNNGSQLFPTIASGIREVAFKLGRSPLYRNHDSVGKLHLYNPDEAYAEKVLTVMNRIAPAADTGGRERHYAAAGQYAYATD